MTYQDLVDSLRIYRPAILLDAVLPRKTRSVFRDVFGLISSISFGVILIGLYFNLSFFSPFEHKVQGLFFISVSFWLTTFLLEAFYNSYYFKDTARAISEGWSKDSEAILGYDVAQIVYNTDPSDVTAGFIFSLPGQRVFFRLGLDNYALKHFLDSRKNKIFEKTLLFNNTRLNLSSYFKAILVADKELSKFLFALGMQERECVGASKWVSRLEEKMKRKSRFWGKDNLGEIPGIGKSWAYGQIFNLKKFAEELEYGISPEETAVQKEILELEGILSRSKGGNALIVADQGSGENDIVYGLVGKIKNGAIFPMLESKLVFSLNGSAFIEASGSKDEFENQFLSLMNEAVSAGNIILVFQDLPGFIENGEKIGSDTMGLLYPYLNSDKIQIIAIADKTRFHQKIESNSALMSVFEIIRPEETSESSLIFALEDEILKIENQTGLRFTYQAVQSIAESASRFFSEGIAIDKAKDLLYEIPALMKSVKKTTVSKEDILSLVELKTGVPKEGILTLDEKEKLINLEKILHLKIVGQDEAVSAISNAMRRSRAGLRNNNRPIGSFLFLGPTGVGKTETAKALAEVFFGQSAPMLRLDMSEYSGPDALTRLIGSFEGNRAGVLSSMLRDQRYGVLLLDEFEKTNREVMDLFLQILDEGFFSDMIGKKVNARNVIIIATSNAGGDMIFKMAEEGDNLSQSKNSLIDSLVSQGQFKPELLNRFDGVILFHPLKNEHLKSIAVLLVKKLESSLSEQGIKLMITDDLINFLVKEGFDPKFGARPMTRVLEEHVEKILAMKLIEGVIQKGATVKFVAPLQNLSSLEVRVVPD